MGIGASLFLIAGGAILIWGVTGHLAGVNLHAIGASDTDVVALKRERNDIDAYLAYQDLGHAFHSTEDFFAHSNYVELMGGVNVGDSIAAKGVTTV